MKAWVIIIEELYGPNNKVNQEFGYAQQFDIMLLHVSLNTNYRIAVRLTDGGEGDGVGAGGTSSCGGFEKLSICIFNL